MWLEVSKDVIKNTNKNLFIVTGYIHDTSSKYYDPNVFENLAIEITKVCDENTPLIVTGDFNRRTGEVDDKYDESHVTESDIRPTTSIALPMRKNCDSVLNQQGRSILELCQIFNLKILNGRSKGDPLRNFTYNNANLGALNIDYSICSQNIYEYINNFMVLPQNELSDHCKIVTELKGSEILKLFYKTIITGKPSRTISFGMTCCRHYSLKIWKMTCIK